MSCLRKQFDLPINLLPFEIEQIIGRPLSGIEIFELEVSRYCNRDGHCRDPIEVKNQTVVDVSDESSNQLAARPPEDKYDVMKYDIVDNGMTETRTSDGYTIVCYFKNRKLHKLRNAAKIISKNGILIKQYHYVDGILHRDGKPAIINHETKINEYWEHGEFLQTE